jgi:hypothetical protein
MRARLLLHFTRTLVLPNLLVSLLATGFLQAAGALYRETLPSAGASLSQFAGTCLTAGFLLSSYLHHLFRRHEIPMYHNYGLRLPACLAAAYGVHLALLLPAYFLGLVLQTGWQP